MPWGAMGELLPWPLADSVAVALQPLLVVLRVPLRLEWCVAKTTVPGCKCSWRPPTKSRIFDIAAAFADNAFAN